ncbi:endonuclease/exonuclease/phosphatase family protein [Mesonia sp. HuA40]|uniref:endonuclease/exonuclease/phosphatase family protein n=1 Tax=Mesonia sp. HuA40 TaxID=2602761 RepID=UPI0011C83764|nr:endonuclease/exonuclease/phosphatase family protein [Mesonia sp. HuA40]TXK72450.1 endonuclease/exonuclease/phosphatase family protein [Mesonia sp. HuA40]
MNKQFLLLVLGLFLIGCGPTGTTTNSSNTKKSYQVNTIAFYNLENLFDAEDDPSKNDEYSPIMEMDEGLRQSVYEKKLKNMASVIKQIGSDVAQNAPAVVGVCEIENKKVLIDLLNEPDLLPYNYQIVHYESPDRRGIDVGLIYQKDLFQVSNSVSHELKIFRSDNPDKKVYTRDQLVVSGFLNGDKMHFIVNHWPSRSGGEARSSYLREAAADLNRKIADSLLAIDPYAKIITMGDFNDGPYNKSIKENFGAKAEKETTKLKEFYNPFESMQKSGIGTIAYRDSWDLFDQMLLSHGFLDKDYSTYKYYKAGVFNPPFLATPRGKYKGYPFRSFSNGGFSGGYSDHFPVFVYLIKEIDTSL